MVATTPYTTLSLVTLRPGLLVARWALAQMALGPPQLQRVPGLAFFQLLGSGATNGFGLWPNWRRYGLLAVWENAAAAHEFFAHHPLWAAYQQRALETWTATLGLQQSHGAWNGRDPFADASPLPAPPAGPLAVLTRASIRLGRAWRFWRHIEPASRAVADAPGLRLAIGLGELPLVRQATFSVWESAEAMRQYAYQHPAHREAMRLTRQEGWYSEELFARFVVLGSTGTVAGRDPLAGLLP